ncbi:MAG: Asp-tRNA(Asn)/Glu-tRNA(Gln) amidotransferase subunit GatC [Candidatus Aenigmarchaeota archaeon]|nr:Asp-tRNA(Asn)/Glu-tRNA(Gln) amidotransferase subunit GatC [Candidatus Aenigmarchaeota archaeon]
MPTPKISVETVKHVAKIARLELNSKEIRKFQKDLNDILSAFREIDKINVKKVKPSFQPLEVRDVFREDVPEPSLTQEKALSNTKHKENGYFKGPRVV